MKGSLRRIGLGAALVCTVSAASPDARACAPALPRGAVEPVEIKREEALIVWNGATKEEHFIRRAVFDTKVKSFGFLVPTPTRPSLGEAPPAIFEELAARTKAEVRDEPQLEIIPGCTALCFMAVAKSERSASVSVPAAAVRVLEETRVAGMDATVLAADDTEALSRWLAERDFEMRPALRDWLAPYVTQHFVITAFRYARPDVASVSGAGPALAPSAVRLTFKTERAFYPYREPADSPSVFGRALHVFFVSDAKGEGRLDNAATWPTASTRYADRIEPTFLDTLGVTVPPNAWLTEMVDGASKRVPTDVSFVAAASASPIRPAPIVRRVGTRVVFLPLDLFALIALGVVLFRRRRRRLPRKP